MSQEKIRPRSRVPAKSQSGVAGQRLQRRSVPQRTEVRSWASLPAWSISLLFHVVVLTSLALLWTRTSQGTGAEQGGPVGIAVASYDTVVGEQYALADGSESGDESPLGDLAADAAAAAAGAVAELQAESLAGLLPTGDGSMGDLGDAAGSLGLGAGGAVGGGNRDIPKVTTSVFGVEGAGTRFVYVFDRSDSMNGFGGKPYAAAKAELLKSLETLGQSHQFQIIFYNDAPLPFGGSSTGDPRLLFGTEPSKRDAIQFVRNTQAVGGTGHLDALRMAIRMNPDVIFFLTDADFPALSRSQIDSLHERASRIGATIHCIQFGAGASRNGGGWIRNLAEGSLGQYRYVDVTAL